jgi:hypothetical protein
MDTLCSRAAIHKNNCNIWYQIQLDDSPQEPVRVIQATKAAWKAMVKAK